MTIDEQIRGVEDAIIEAECEMDKVCKLELNFIRDGDEYAKHVKTLLDRLHATLCTLQSVKQMRASFVSLPLEDKRLVEDAA